MIISRILHAGYLFEVEGVKIAFDPIFEVPFSRNCFPFPPCDFDESAIRNLKLDAVFISHHHDDHCSLVSLDLLDRATSIYVYCQNSEMHEMIRALGFERVCTLEVDEPVGVGPFEVVPRLALDPDIDSVFHIRGGGVNVLNVVDAWIDPSALTILAGSAPWDVVLWPFQTLREIEVLSPRHAAPAERRLPSEWIEQLRVLDPRIIVPSSCQFVHESWSWYNRALFPVSYGRFSREIGEALPRARIVRMDPSVSLEITSSGSKTATPLPWVKTSGELVDYEFDANLVVPSTAEVARYIPQLTSEQTKMVLDYCREGLLERYARLESSDDGYFRKPRSWLLRLYDHEGSVREFEYRLSPGSMTLASGDAIEWCTDVPMAKLHAALASGESLTSMYVRINDIDFESEIEKEIAAADPLEDPLVRSLYTGVFGEYQRAQLEIIERSRGG